MIIPSYQNRKGKSASIKRDRPRLKKKRPTESYSEIAEAHLTDLDIHPCIFKMVDKRTNKYDKLFGSAYSMQYHECNIQEKQMIKDHYDPGSKENHHSREPYRAPPMVI